MASPDINYQSLSDENPFRNVTSNSAHDDDDMETHNDNEDTPRNSGIMIHIVPETSKARWNHIDDLDSFFTRMYTYHQEHGFTVIVLEEIFQLCQFGFVVWLLTFTIHCFNYAVLFGNSPPANNNTKVTLNDVIIPTKECVKNFGGMTYIILFLATLYFMIRLVKIIYQITQYSDIKKFYNTALHIDDDDLDNITWHEVKRKIREVQTEQHMCIDKEHLTELDIYHRILRFKNYMVALMNKDLLPVRYRLPIIGEIVSLSRSLLFNVDFILFRTPCSPFQNNWQLRDDYTVRGNQAELAKNLSQLIMWVALANLLLAPIIFVWQLIYFSFSYANILRKEPGALGTRTWSNYGRLRLKHFNELDHELDARLNRAYEYADRYMSSFCSPLMAVIARHILFISGGLLILILALGIYEEFVFQVEHVLTIITALSVIGLVCRTLIPDENLIWCPEQLMTAILAHVHYLPTDWKTQAHTKTVREQFGHFFQYKATYFFNEICSPLTTPFVLMFVFRPKALEIVKFFRSFTVTVRGVGNVCSFAQMDVRKHGNPEWQIQTSGSNNKVAAGTATIAPTTPAAGSTSSGGSEDDNTKRQYPVENGKTELSLVRFTLTNPEWQMPSDAENFIKGIRENALKDLLMARRAQAQEDQGVVENPLAESLLSFGSMANEYTSIANSVFQAHHINGAVLANSMHRSMQHHERKPASAATATAATMRGAGNEFEQMLQQNLGDPLSMGYGAMSMSSVGSLDSMRKMRVCKTEGRLEGPSESLLYSLTGVEPRLTTAVGTDVTVADMCLSTLYLHEVHKKNVTKHQQRTSTTKLTGRTKLEQQQATSSSSGSARQTIITSPHMAEHTPLLGNIRS